MGLNHKVNAISGRHDLFAAIEWLILRMESRMARNIQNGLGLMASFVNAAFLQRAH